MLRILAALICMVGSVCGGALAQPLDTSVAANYAPLMLDNDPDRPGYAIEVLHEAAARAGRQVDITFVPFERAMHRLQTEEATLMPALFYGKRRNDDFLWVAEIQRARLHVATLSDPIANLEDARALGSILVESGTTADTMLTNAGFENLIRVSSPEASARMLEFGRADAWFQNVQVMQQIWHDLDFDQPLVVGKVIHEVPIFLVASRMLPVDVAEAYQTAVQTMKDDGTLAALWARYTAD